MNKIEQAKTGLRLAVQLAAAPDVQRAREVAEDVSASLVNLVFSEQDYAAQTLVTMLTWLAIAVPTLTPKQVAHVLEEIELSALDPDIAGD